MSDFAFQRHNIRFNKFNLTKLQQNKFDEIGRIKEETREVNLNGDDKRFWLGHLVDIFLFSFDFPLLLFLDFFLIIWIITPPTTIAIIVVAIVDTSNKEPT